MIQETRTWDEAGQCTVAMRKKEGLADYRYFPEPDLPNLVVDEAFMVGHETHRACNQDTHLYGI